MKPRLAVAFAALIILSSCSRPADDAAQNEIVVNQLFSGGLIYDGSGGAPFSGDLGVSDGRIVFLGNAGESNVVAAETFDVSGHWVTPGFVDAHSHAKLSEDYGYKAEPFLYQGITTVVLGVDGAGENIAEQFQKWQSTGIGVNGILYIGHGAIREQVLGREDRAPTDEELDTMRELVRQGMDEGAFGLSTGLFYVPGTYAATEEVIELAKVAASFGNAIYDTHDRDLGAVYQGVGYDASVEEGIRIAEESGTRGIFSHYNLQGARNYGRAEVGAKLINDARARGVDVWAAHHPYTATQSNLRSYTIPDWASAGGKEEMVARFDDPELSEEIKDDTNAMLDVRGGADKILFVDPDPDLSGKTLAQISRERELQPADAVQDILRKADASVMNLELYDAVNTRRLAQEPWMMTCTDGVTPRPDQPNIHPRTFGAFPMKMRLFVFDEPLLEPQFVIRSYTGLAADFFRLPDRGYLREGYVADVTILDPDRYRDLATYEQPQQYSEGVLHVLVNGEFAIRDGELTGTLAGMPLRKP